MITINFFYNRKIIKESKRINKLYPEITDEKIIDLLAKDRVYSKSFRNCILMFIFSILFTIILQCVIDLYSTLTLFPDFLYNLAMATFTLFTIISIIKFFSIRSHLDKRDELFLEQYKADHNIKRSSDKLLKVPVIGKVILRLLRINMFLLLAIFALLIGGIISTVTGANTLITYEESMRNSLKIEAIVVDCEFNQDEDNTYYLVDYEYTYNDVTFVYSTKSSYKEEIGSTDTLLIDSKKPHKVIDSDGSELLTSGIIMLSISLLLLIISLIKTRKADSVFSLFDLFAMIFYLATIGFAIWGVIMLISGSLWGLIILLGSLFFFFAGYAFIKVQE